MKVKGTYGFIYGRGYNDVVSGSEGYVSDFVGVFRESDEVEVIEGVLYFDLR